MGRAIEAITAVRRYRDEAGVRPSAVLPGRLDAEGYEGLDHQVARLARIDLSAQGDAVAEVALPGGSLHLLPSEDFDHGAVERRTSAERERLDGEIERLRAKLANERFVERAPTEVVEGERKKLEEYIRALKRLG